MYGTNDRMPPCGLRLKHSYEQPKARTANNTVPCRRAYAWAAWTSTTSFLIYGKGVSYRREGAKYA